MNAELMSLAERVAWTLFHSLWQFSLIAVGLWIATKMLRDGSSRIRYGADCFALVLMVLVAITTFTVVDIDPVVSNLRRSPARRPHSANVTSTADIGIGTPLATAPLANALPPGRVPPEVDGDPPANSVLQSSTPDQASPQYGFVALRNTLRSVVSPWLPTILISWIVGVLLLSLRPIIGWQGTRRLRYQGTASIPGEMAALVHRVAQRVGVKRAVQVMESALVDVPTVMGCWRPLILLPASAITGLPREQLEAVIAHELGHIRRYDYLINAIQVLLETVFFYHPAIWWVSRQMRNDREICCDDIAVALTGDRFEYAKLLLWLDGMRGTPAPAVSAAGGSLFHRIQRIVAPRPQRSVTGGLLALSLVTLSCIASGLWLATYAAEPQRRSDEPTEPVTATTEPDRPTGSVFGVIIDDAGQPLADVEVQALTPMRGFHSSFSIPTGGDRLPAATVTSDAAGRFQIDTIPLDATTKRRNSEAHDVQLQLTAAHRHVNSQNYPVGEPLRIKMSGSGKTGRIRGRVVDRQTQQPIESYRLVRRHDADMKSVESEDGVFDISQLTRGRDYHVYVYAKGYAATKATITAVDDASHEVPSIELEPAPALNIRLVSADTGQPISNARIMAAIVGDGRYIEWSSFDRYVDGYHAFDFVQRVRTDDRGRAWFASALEGEQASLFVLADGYERTIVTGKAWQAQIQRGGDVITITLKQEAAIEGSLKLADVPVADAEVTIAPVDDAAGLDQTYESTRTDDRGEFRIGQLTAGTYLVFAGAYGKKVQVAESSTLEYRLNFPAENLTILGETLPDAQIQIAPLQPQAITFYKVTADEHGRFRLAGLVPGEYRADLFAVSSTGYIIGQGIPSFTMERDEQTVDFSTHLTQLVEDKQPLPEPNSDAAKELYEYWKQSARSDGSIPGGLIGQLATQVDQFIKSNFEADDKDKLPAIRDRMDANRDWQPKEAIELINDIGDIHIAPLGWASMRLKMASFRSIIAGKPLPKSLVDAAWGEPAESGLRAAWLLEREHPTQATDTATPTDATDYPLGTVLKPRVLFHNAGDADVVFATETFHQDDLWTVIDAAGNPVVVHSIWYSGVTPSLTCRLRPGEYTEVSAAGVAIGAGKYEEEQSLGKVGAIIEAQVGDSLRASWEVKTHDPDRGGWADVDADGNRNDDRSHYIRKRVMRESPLPTDSKDRNLLLQHVHRDLFGSAADEKDLQWFAEQTDGALEALVQRLLAKPVPHTHQGSLRTGTVKFGVTAEDLAARQTPRTATTPGRFVLGERLRLLVSRTNSDARYSNRAIIVSLPADGQDSPSQEMATIPLPDGLNTYAIGWVEGSGSLFVARRDQADVEEYLWSTNKEVQTLMHSETSGKVSEQLREQFARWRTTNDSKDSSDSSGGAKP